MMRFNFLQAPFDNAAIRRALLGAVNQADVMTAVATDDPSMWHVPSGFFCPGTPMASDVGIAALTGPRDYAKVKAELAAAGYKGERVVLLAATDFPVLKAMSDVCADMLQKAGLNVDYQALDWGTVNQRRVKKDPVEQGGWSCFCTAWAGTDMINPAGQLALRTNGANAWIGWPDDPRLEADLRRCARTGSMRPTLLPSRASRATFRRRRFSFCRICRSASICRRRPIRRSFQGC